MKFEYVPGMSPVFGLESIDLGLLTLAIPAALGLFLGLRKEQAMFAAVIFGAAMVLAN